MQVRGVVGRDVMRELDIFPCAGWLLMRGAGAQKWAGLPQSCRYVKVPLGFPRSAWMSHAKVHGCLLRINLSTSSKLYAEEDHAK